MSRILVTRAFLPSLDEYVREIGDIWETHWLTNMGAKHEQLRQALCEYLAVPEAELFTNGHMALEMSLQAMDLEDMSVGFACKSEPAPDIRRARALTFHRLAV